MRYKSQLIVSLHVKLRMVFLILNTFFKISIFLKYKGIVWIIISRTSLPKWKDLESGKYMARNYDSFGPTED